MSSSNVRTSADVGQRETSSLIAASKVKGTSVFNRQNETLGSIYDVMLDKRTGHVTYAVMSFGGFLGIGEKYHPLPWHLLTYNEERGGYIVDLDKQRLEGAPSYAVSQTPDWSTGVYGSSIDKYYGGQPALR